VDGLADGLELGLADGEALGDAVEMLHVGFTSLVHVTQCC
jgi:hypothetical protein